MSEWTADDRADWEQQADNERRMYEAEVARYRAENPLWDRCRNHSERLSVDPMCYDKQYCRECIEQRRAAYTGQSFGHDYRETWRGEHVEQERK